METIKRIIFTVLVTMIVTIVSSQPFYNVNKTSGDVTLADFYFSEHYLKHHETGKKIYRIINRNPFRRIPFIKEKRYGEKRDLYPIVGLYSYTSLIKRLNESEDIRSKEMQINYKDGILHLRHIDFKTGEVIYDGILTLKSIKYLRSIYSTSYLHNVKSKYIYGLDTVKIEGVVAYCKVEFDEEILKGTKSRGIYNLILHIECTNDLEVSFFGATVYYEDDREIIEEKLEKYRRNK